MLHIYPSLIKTSQNESLLVSVKGHPLPVRTGLSSLYCDYIKPLWLYLVAVPTRLLLLQVVMMPIGYVTAYEHYNVLCNALSHEENIFCLMGM